MKKSTQFGLFLLLFVSPPTFAIRIISTSPQITEMMFQLGKGHDLVAGSSLKPPFPEAASLPDIGPAFMPSVERTLELRPDWVLLDDFFVPVSYERSLESLRIPFIKISVSSLATLFETSRSLLKTLYRETTNAPLARFENCGKNLSKIHRQESFLAFTWFSPPILFGRKSFLSSVLEQVGMKNSGFSHLKISFPQVSAEWLIAQRVERAYYMAENPSAEKEALQQMGSWWPSARPHITPLNPDYFGRETFSALKHLTDLWPESAVNIPRECRDLP